MNGGCSRRSFLGGASAFAVAGCAQVPLAEEDAVRWHPGELLVHFLHTGTGEQTFFQFPDGTTMLLDCGHVKRKPAYVESVPPCPSDRLTGGGWTARYLSRILDRREIDYVMVSHWHDDHVMGLSDVAKDFTFRHWLDHQGRRLGAHACDPSPDSLRFAREFVPSAVSRGMTAAAFEPGACDQIALLNDTGRRYAGFEIRNLAANGVLWDGRSGTRDFAAEHVRITGKDAIPENRLSAAFRLRYGAFTYYSGGDLEQTFRTEEGERDWEAAVGAVCGPADVCKTNHHAYWNAMHAGFVREIRARVYLSSVWSPNQVNDRNLPVICSRELYPGERTVYFGTLPKEKTDAYAGRPFLRDIAPAQGHVLVKVPEGGRAFTVFTLAPGDEATPQVTSRRSFAWELYI